MDEKVIPVCGCAIPDPVAMPGIACPLCAQCGRLRIDTAPGGERLSDGSILKRPAGKAKVLP